MAFLNCGCDFSVTLSDNSWNETYELSTDGENCGCLFVVFGQWKGQLLGIFYLYTKMRVKNAGAGDLFTFGLNTEALLDFLESGAQILLSAALLPQQSRKHLVCGHLDLSKWGFLEFA